MTGKVSERFVIWDYDALWVIMWRTMVIFQLLGSIQVELTMQHTYSTLQTSVKSKGVQHYIQQWVVQCDEV